ncbi:MAG: hypothetical protein ACR2HG_08565 [Pyrinomonadaceae bacterium]
MSLIICPECAHEVASTATACPNCGHPFARPVVQSKVIVRELPPERDEFPKWIFIPLGILGAVLLLVLFAWMRNSNDDEAQRNINVRVTQPGSSTRETTTSVPSSAQPNQVIVPPSSSQPSQIVVPPSAAPQPPTITTVPSTETVAPDKGTVSLEAKVFGKNGSPQPVRGTKFYLLKEDAESVINTANIENQTGQAPLTALGMSMVYPDRYGDFSRKAMNAIGKNAVYNATTDGSGKLQLKDVKPNNYYLFAITKSGNGFAVWSQPVTIQPGVNSLILEPTTPTEVSEPVESH